LAHGVLLGCAPDKVETASGGLPTLALHHVTNDIETSPNSMAERAIVGPDGKLVFAADRESDWLVTVLDSNGAFLAGLGRRGSGPGEMQMAQVISIGDEGVTMFDPVQQRLVIAGLDDSLHSQVTFTEQFFPFHRWQGQLLGLSLGPAGFRVMVADIATGKTRDIVPPSDSFLTTTFPKPQLTSQAEMMAMRVPGVGYLGDKLVVGEGHSYRLMVYNADGTTDHLLSRDIPPAVLGKVRLEAQIKTMRDAMNRFGAAGPEMESQMEAAIKSFTERKIPHFGALALLSDSADRGWVIGSVGDSAFADIFTEGQYLGRLGIACRGFNEQWSLSGNWLAMVCMPDDPEDDRDALIKVFHIS
jgi:hypothetical protein